MNVYNDRAVLKLLCVSTVPRTCRGETQINFHAPLTGVDQSDPRSGRRHLQASTPDLRVLVDRSHGEARTWLEEIISYSCGNVGHAVAQLVEVRRYKPEGRGFDSLWCHWDIIRIMALGSTELLTEISTRNISWG